MATSNRKGFRYTPHDELHPGEHAAIVPRELFDAVALQMRSRRREGMSLLRNKHGALLKGLLFCGACGSPMQFHSTRKADRIYGSYVCVKSMSEGAKACPGSRAPSGQLEAFVVERVRAVGSDPAVADAAVEAAQAEQKARVPELTAAIREHEAEERRLVAEQVHLTDAIGRGVSALGERLSQVDRLLQDARKRAQAARAKLLAIDERTLDEAALRKALAGFEPVWNELFPKERARILRLLIERVLFDPRTSEVEISFRGGAPAVLGRSA